MGRAGILVVAAFLLLPLVGLPHGGANVREATQTLRPDDADVDRDGEIGEGRQLLYLVKEIIETTSDFTHVVWVRGAEVIATRSRVLEGAEVLTWYEVSGLTVRLAKKALDTTRVVIAVETLALRGDFTANLTIEKGGLGYTRSELYAYNITKGEFAGLAEFLNDDPLDPEPYRFELDIALLYEMPAATANVERVAKELEKKVLAFYYNWYGSPQGPSGKLVGWDVPVPHSPLIGPYDSADEIVIYSHMEMAKYAGIDAFIANWIGPGASVEAKSMPTLLRIAEEVGMKVSAYADMPLDIPLAYTTHPAWLKDSGRPVIFHYNVERQGGPSDWVEWRREAEDAYGPLLLIGGTTDEGYIHVFDGFHTYIHTEDDFKEFYENATQKFEVALLPQVGVDEAFTSAYAGEEVPVAVKSFSLTVIPGYDDTPNPERYPGFRLERQSGELYESFWKTAIDLEAHSVLITSWNEWLEGTEIEPSAEHGFDYLRLTRQFVEEYKNVSLPSPEADYSATIFPFELGPDSRGKGDVLINAGDEGSMILAQVEVRGLEGVRSVDVQGDFVSYIKDQRGLYVAVVVPAVRPGRALAVLAVFEADSLVVRLEVSISAYDPFGTLHRIFAEQVEARGIPPLLLGALGIGSVLVAVSVVLWIRRYRVHRKR